MELELGEATVAKAVAITSLLMTAMLRARMHVDRPSRDQTWKRDRPDKISRARIELKREIDGSADIKRRPEW